MEASRFGVVLVLGPWRLQVPNPQRDSGLPEGEFEGTRDGSGQDPSLSAKATHVIWPLVEEASAILLGICSWAWETSW